MKKSIFYFILTILLLYTTSYFAYSTDWKMNEYWWRMPTVVVLAGLNVECFMRALKL